jgi:hypothetical protein
VEFGIAGRTIDDPLGAVADYVRDNERTIREFDLVDPPSGPDELSAQDLLRTRYTRVRVDSDEIQYFVDKGRGAPWMGVPADADLVDADPNVEGGLYDAAEALYMHFFTGRRRGITPVKIHTCLHLKRRGLYPLLDGRILDIYEDTAREVSKQVEGRRGRRGRLYWAAIREDLVANADAFDALRSALAGSDEPLSLAAELTDVRLHDILCWSLVSIRR